MRERKFFSTTNPFALQVTEVEPDMIPNLKSQTVFISYFTAQKTARELKEMAVKGNPLIFHAEEKLTLINP